MNPRKRQEIFERLRAARTPKKAQKALSAASRVVLFCAISGRPLIGLSLVRFWQKDGKGAALNSNQAGFSQATRPAQWRNPSNKARVLGLPAIIKCNSMVVAPAGHARRGADRTDAQREAAGKNLLFQQGARKPPRPRWLRRWGKNWRQKPPGMAT